MGVKTPYRKIKKCLTNIKIFDIINIKIKEMQEKIIKKLKNISRKCLTVSKIYDIMYI